MRTRPSTTQNLPHCRDGKCTASLATGGDTGPRSRLLPCEPHACHAIWQELNTSVTMSSARMNHQRCLCKQHMSVHNSWSCIDWSHYHYLQRCNAAVDWSCEIGEMGHSWSCTCKIRCAWCSMQCTHARCIYMQGHSIRTSGYRLYLQSADFKSVTTCNTLAFLQVFP